jgi:hypothetical protein
MALFSFNAADHNASVSFMALPKGWYQAKLIESETAPTKGNGQMMKFTAEILAPEWAKGRKAFLRYNIVNNNPEAVRIGLEQMAALSIAAGHPRWENTEELHERPFHLKLKVTPADDQYDEGNDAAGYDAITVHRALAKQVAVGGPAGSIPTVGAPAFPGAAPSFPGAAAPVVAFPGAAAPVVQQPVVQQPQVQQPVVQQPAAVAQPQVWAGAQQPWDANAQAAAAAQAQPQVQQPVVQQPVQQPQVVMQPQQVVTPEPMPVQQQVVQTPPVQTAPVQQPVAEQPQVQVQQPQAQQPAAAGAPMTMPWAQAQVNPVQPAAQAAAVAQPQQAAEAHPAQAAVPPWQTPAAQ